MVIVARDGSGDYTSLQEAIDRIPDGSGAPTLILIRRGVYQERVVIHRNHVRLVGESAEDTVLTACAAATDRDRNGLEKGTFRTATLMITGNDVEIDHLTIRNDAGDGREVGQAVAVYAAGDRGVFRGCRLIAHQDTLFCGPLRIPNGTEDTGARCGNAEAYYRIEDGHETHSRQYFEDCYIEGDVDFIFGCYRSWFERCTLHMGPRGGWYTAANTSAAQPYGFVFHRCELTGSCAPGQAFLGRPWRGSAATVFLDCGMDEHVAPEGFTDWDAGRAGGSEYPPSGAEAPDGGGRAGHHLARGAGRMGRLAAGSPRADLVPLRGFHHGQLWAGGGPDDRLGAAAAAPAAGCGICSERGSLRQVQQKLCGGRAAAGYRLLPESGGPAGDLLQP